MNSNVVIPCPCLYSFLLSRIIWPSSLFCSASVFIERKVLMTSLPYSFIFLILTHHQHIFWIHINPAHTHPPNLREDCKLFFYKHKTVHIIIKKRQISTE